MATVPQKVIRNTALSILDPPVLAANAPRVPKNKIANTYNEYSMPFMGAKSTTKREVTLRP